MRARISLFDRCALDDAFASSAGLQPLRGISRQPKEPMNASDDTQDDISRRAFLLSSSGLFTSMWVAAQWPAIAAAAHHAEQVSDAAPAHFEFFSAADAADVEAIGAQIVPSGATSGAREAHAVYFIDRSLATYFSPMAPDYRHGLAEFQSKFRAANPKMAA